MIEYVLCNIWLHAYLTTDGFLFQKSIRSLSAKLHRRNQLTPERNLSSQTPVVPWQELKTPGAKNQPQSLLWLGWRNGICISHAAPSPKPEQRCPCRYSRTWGTLSKTCARDKKSPLPADRLSQHLFLASCFLLPPCKIEVRISTKPCCRKKGGWEVVLHTFFLNLFCGGKCHTAKGTGGEKLKWEISYWNILEVCQAPRPLGVRIHKDGITGWERIKNNIFMSILRGYKRHWNMGIWPQMKTT